MTTGSSELRREFGLSTATYVVIASMIGTGILVTPGYMMASLGNHAVILALWSIGGVLALCGALCVAELAAALPRAGGEYVYLREAYGPMPAFLSGWTSFFVGFSAPLAVSSHVAALYLLTPLGAGEVDSVASGYVSAVAALIIVAMTIPNLFGHRQTAWTQNATTVVELGLFVGFVLLAFAIGKGGVTLRLVERSTADVEVGAVATQLFFVMFAFSGWNGASYVAGEVRNPGKTLPKALILGTGLVTVLYLAVNIVLLRAVPLADVGMANAERVPQLAARNLFGSGASHLFSFGVGLTFLATVSALVVTGPRIYYAMAKDRLFPSVAGRLSQKGGVPVQATLAQSACAIVILFATDFENLYRYAAVGLSLFTMLFVGAVCVLRWRRPGLERPFRVPGYPVTPLVYVAAMLFMAVFAFTQWPWPSTLSLVTILAGVPVYYLWRSVTQVRR